jgi:predicted nucleotidyltransferase
METLRYHFLGKLKKLPFVEQIFLYGSRAREDCRSRSDIDLAVVCPQASTEQWQLILDIIEEADTLLKIDCVRYDQLTDDALKKNIDRDKKVIYQKEDS